MFTAFQPPRFLAPILACCALCTHAPESTAGIIFSRSADDLLVDITAPIEFTATAGATDSNFVLAIRNVYSTPVSTNILSNSQTVTTQLDLGGASSDNYFAWGQVPSFGPGFEETGFYGFYQFNAPQSVSPGDNIEITAGVVRLTDYFNTPGAELPDLPAGNIQLLSLNSRTQLGSAAVPEPSSIALLTMGIGGVYLRRRKKAASAAEQT